MNPLMSEGRISRFRHVCTNQQEKPMLHEAGKELHQGNILGTLSED